MSQLTIYHNPRCSKSRQTLALLTDRNLDPQIVLYLDNPPAPDELDALLKKLGISARQLLRKGEEAFKQLNLADQSISDDEIVQAMSGHPKLIERPIVVKGNQAVLGRPPENVLSLIE